MIRQGTRILRVISHAVAWLEEGFLCLLLFAMILLSCWQIISRDFFSGGYAWIDPLLRYLVLWVGLLGASLATRKGKHIAIDLASYMATERAKPWIKLAGDLFSTLVAGVLTFAAIIFVRNEVQFSGDPLLAIPSWGWNMIFPLAFGMICIRFLHTTLTGLAAVFRAKSVSSDESGGTP
ncbi:MAG: TRAP transporter small permease [Desulfobulbaceae bacterium]|nr:TRAP transporter small permease [Desulfobulbaceae bacterium]